jgi:hypothetical protein
MTYRTICGMRFKVWSPSLLELDAYDDGSLIATVSLAYVPKAWYIDILMKAGHSLHRGPFRSRDDAIALLAGRQTHVA